MKLRWNNVVDKDDVLLVTFVLDGIEYTILGVVQRKTAIEIDIKLFNPPLTDIPDGTEAYVIVSKPTGSYLFNGFIRLYILSQGLMVLVPVGSVVYWDRRKMKRFNVRLRTEIAWGDRDEEFVAMLEDMNVFGAKVSISKEQFIFWNVGFEEPLGKEGMLFIVVPYKGEIVSFVVRFFVKWVRQTDKDVYMGLEFIISNDDVKQYLEYFSRILF
ncbi:hypothetical protein GM182_01715 [bacterium 3DAC]|nr:hypothetical protein GM182_01715 [bacterium 3DAC]